MYSKITDQALQAQPKKGRPGLVRSFLLEIAPLAADPQPQLMLASPAKKEDTCGA